MPRIMATGTAGRRREISVLNRCSARPGVRLWSVGSLLAPQGAEVVAVVRLGGQRGGARPAVAGVAAAPRQLVAAALVHREPGVPLAEALGDDEIDPHQSAAAPDHPQRASLDDGAAVRVNPPVALD